jgi:2-aminoethylphosphonate-pyruvate transaminase
MRDLVLFTPGPVRIPSLVADYLKSPPCNYHRQDAFRAMTVETERDCKKLLGIKNADAYHATLMTATGTGANEGCMLAFEGLGKGLIPYNGWFGERLAEQVKQNRMNVELLALPQDRPMNPSAVAAALDGDPSIKWVFFVSHETRAGMKNPMEQIGAVCHARGRMVGADMISSAYAYAVDIEAAQLDLSTASSAKAIMAAPGIGIVFVKKSSMAALKATAAPRGYYLDVIAETERQMAEQQPRFAQPVVLHAALRAACIHMNQIGIDNHMARIQRQMADLISHLASMSIHPILDAAYRSNIAVNFRLPAGFTYKRFSKQMEEHGFFCLYGIPGDETHFQLSTIGDLSDAHIDGAKAALSQVFASRPK